jgi:endoglucanase
MTETCWGALEFWEGYRLANQTQYLNQMVRWGMDWLIKAHPNNNTLYVQVHIPSRPKGFVRKTTVRNWV